MMGHEQNRSPVLSCFASIFIHNRPFPLKVDDYLDSRVVVYDGLGENTRQEIAGVIELVQLEYQKHKTQQRHP